MDRVLTKDVVPTAGVASEREGVRVVSGGHYQRILVAQHVHGFGHSVGESNCFVQRSAGLTGVMGEVYATA